MTSERGRPSTPPTPFVAGRDEQAASPSKPPGLAEKMAEALTAVRPSDDPVPTEARQLPTPRVLQLGSPLAPAPPVPVDGDSAQAGSVEWL